MEAKKFLSIGIIFLGIIMMYCTGRLVDGSQADLVVLNARVFTVDQQHPWAEAVAIKGDKIIAVAAMAEIKKLIGSRTQVINANGRLVLPGFNDAHVHFRSGGLSLLGIKLRDAKDEQEFAQRIKEKAQTLPKGTWITGGKWDHEVWPSKKYPTKELIDPFTPDHPVMVDRLDGHIALANSLALKLAGITRDTPNPQGGEIVRDPPTGKPTGILKDTAQDLVYKVIPPPTDEQIRQAIQAALAHAAQMGVTSIQDNSSDTDLRIYQELLKKGELTVRVYAWRPVEYLQEFRKLGIEADFGGDLLRIGCLKIYSDGSMGAGSALFFEPYQDDSSTCGLSIYPEEELTRIVVQADAAGLQMAIHAIGDRANHMVLNALEQAIQKNGHRDSRHRIEHAQVVVLEDVERYRQLGVIASIQPSHCIDDIRWAEKRIGPKRCRNAYRFKSFREAEVAVAFGTDWPVEPLNPMLGLYAAVTREFPEGGPQGGWFPEEKLSLEEAIELYTLGSAYAEFAENVKGSITPGKLADLVVLSQNLFQIPPKEILNTEVVYTILGGMVIYENRKLAGTGK